MSFARILQRLRPKLIKYPIIAKDSSQSSLVTAMLATLGRMLATMRRP